MFPICLSQHYLMHLSTFSHPFTRGEITDENGVNYIIKRLTNHPAAIIQMQINS